MTIQIGGFSVSEMKHLKSCFVKLIFVAQWKSSSLSSSLCGVVPRRQRTVTRELPLNGAGGDIQVLAGDEDDDNDDDDVGGEDQFAIIGNSGRGVGRLSTTGQEDPNGDERARMTDDGLQQSVKLPTVGAAAAAEEDDEEEHDGYSCGEEHEEDRVNGRAWRPQAFSEMLADFVMGGVVRGDDSGANGNPIPDEDNDDDYEEEEDRNVEGAATRIGSRLKKRCVQSPGILSDSDEAVSPLDARLRQRVDGASRGTGRRHRQRMHETSAALPHEVSGSERSEEGESPSDEHSYLLKTRLFPPLLLTRSSGRRSFDAPSSISNGVQLPDRPLKLYCSAMCIFSPPMPADDSRTPLCEGGNTGNGRSSAFTDEPLMKVSSGCAVGGGVEVFCGGGGKPLTRVLDKASVILWPMQSRLRIMLASTETATAGSRQDPLRPAVVAARRRSSVRGSGGLRGTAVGDPFAQLPTTRGTRRSRSTPPRVEFLRSGAPTDTSRSTVRGDPDRLASREGDSRRFRQDGEGEEEEVQQQHCRECQMKKESGGGSVAAFDVVPTLGSDDNDRGLFVDASSRGFSSSEEEEWASPRPASVDLRRSPRGASLRKSSALRLALGRSSAPRPARRRAVGVRRRWLAAAARHGERVSLLSSNNAVLRRRHSYAVSGSGENYKQDEEKDRSSPPTYDQGQERPPYISESSRCATCGNSTSDEITRMQVWQFEVLRLLDFLVAARPPPHEDDTEAEGLPPTDEERQSTFMAEQPNMPNGNITEHHHHRHQKKNKKSPPAALSSSSSRGSNIRRRRSLPVVPLPPVVMFYCLELPASLQMADSPFNSNAAADDSSVRDSSLATADDCARKHLQEAWISLRTKFDGGPVDEFGNLTGNGERKSSPHRRAVGQLLQMHSFPLVDVRCSGVVYRRRSNRQRFASSPPGPESEHRRSGGEGDMPLLLQRSDSADLRDNISKSVSGGVVRGSPICNSEAYRETDLPKSSGVGGRRRIGLFGEDVKRVLGSADQLPSPGVRKGASASSLFRGVPRSGRAAHNATLLGSRIENAVAEALRRVLSGGRHQSGATDSLASRQANGSNEVLSPTRRTINILEHSSSSHDRRQAASDAIAPTVEECMTPIELPAVWHDRQTQPLPLLIISQWKRCVEKVTTSEPPSAEYLVRLMEPALCTLTSEKTWPMKYFSSPPSEWLSFIEKEEQQQQVSKLSNGDLRKRRIPSHQPLNMGIQDRIEATAPGGGTDSEPKRDDRQEILSIFAKLKNAWHASNSPLEILTAQRGGFSRTAGTSRRKGTSPSASAIFVNNASGGAAGGGEFSLGDGFTEIRSAVRMLTDGLLEAAGIPCMKRLWIPGPLCQELDATGSPPWNGFLFPPQCYSIWAGKRFSSPPMLSLDLRRDGRRGSPASIISRTSCDSPRRILHKVRSGAPHHSRPAAKGNAMSLTPKKKKAQADTVIYSSAVAAEQVRPRTKNGSSRRVEGIDANDKNDEEDNDDDDDKHLRCKTIATATNTNGARSAAGPRRRRSDARSEEKKKNGRTRSLSSVAPSSSTEKRASQELEDLCQSLRSFKATLAAAKSRQQRRLSV